MNFLKGIKGVAAVIGLFLFQTPTASLAQETINCDTLWENGFLARAFIKEEEGADFTTEIYFGDDQTPDIDIITASRTLNLPCKKRGADKSAGGAVVKAYYSSEWETPARLEHIDRAINAAAAALTVYESYGDTEDVVMLFLNNEYDGRRVLPYAAWMAWTVPDFIKPGSEPCAVGVTERAIDFPEATREDEIPGFEEKLLWQIIAHEVFHCFQYSNFLEQTGWHDGLFNTSLLAATRWWKEGTAVSFSELVYPDTQGEFETARRMDPIRQMFDKESPYRTAPFFMSFAQQASPKAVIDFLHSLPAGASGARSVDEAAAAQLRSLAAFPNMDSIFHQYAEDLTEQLIEDSSGAYLPTNKTFAKETIIPDAGMSDSIETDPFALQWFRYTTAGDKTFKFALTDETGDGIASYRVLGEKIWTEGWPIDLEVGGCGEEGLEILVTAHGDDASEPYEAEFEFEEVPGAVAPPPVSACGGVQDACLVGHWRLDWEKSNLIDIGENYANLARAMGLQVDIQKHERNADIYASAKGCARHKGSRYRRVRIVDPGEEDALHIYKGSHYGRSQWATKDGMLYSCNREIFSRYQVRNDVHFLNTRPGDIERVIMRQTIVDGRNQETRYQAFETAAAGGPPVPLSMEEPPPGASVGAMMGGAGPATGAAPGAGGPMASAEAMPYQCSGDTARIEVPLPPGIAPGADKLIWVYERAD